MSVLDYITSPAGGSITGFRTLNEKGFVNISTESVWIAVFVFFILFQLFLLLHPLVDYKLAGKSLMNEPKVEPKEEVPHSSSGETTPTTSTEGITHAEEPEIQSTATYDSILGIGCAFRDAYLILLGTALVGMSGFGFYGPSLTLTWILFAILMMWSFSQLISLTLLAGLIELSSIFVGMVLVIILWGMAYYKPQIPGFS